MIRFNKQKVIKIFPFLFLGYLFDKASQAFTSASGANIGDKIIEGMNNFGKVFADPIPRWRYSDI